MPASQFERQSMNRNKMGMYPSNPAPPKVSIRLRINASDRDLIDHAATRCSKSRPQFILEAARSAAEDALLNRIPSDLDSDHFATFAALLDEPPRPNERLKALLATPAPWED